MTDNLLEEAPKTEGMAGDKLAGTTEKTRQDESNAVPLEKVAVEGDRPSNIPEKFWDKKGKAINLGALVKSYQELERKLSGSLPRPETDEDRMKVFKALGQPDSHDQYDVDVSHGMFDVDEDLNRQMFEKGFTSDQVQAVYDLAAEKFVPMVFEIAQEFQADREVERLVSAFGGEEKWQEVSRQLLAYGKKNLPAHVLTNLASSFEGVMALYRMMKGQEPALEGDLFAMAGDVVAISDDEMKKMMRDPRYWRDKDPSFVSKVTKAFQQKYAE